MTDLRALVVDDEKQLRDISRGVLESKGLKVEAAETCEEGVEMLLRDPEYHLVLTDLNQRPKSGVDVVEKARELYPGIEAYIMTGGSVIPGLIQKAQESVGQDHLLLKPFSITVLSKIAEVVYQKFEKTQL
jgi:CheY-like chemotaxis protein